MRCLIWISLALPVAAQPAKRVNFEDNAKQVFERHCLTCHSASQMTAGLSLESYQGVLRGGGSGEIVKPGRAGASLLYQVLAQDTDGVPHMPLGQPKLPENEIALIRSWIDDGLLADAHSQPKGQTAAPVEMKPIATAAMNGPMPEHLPALTLAESKRPQPITSLAVSPTAPLVAVSGHDRIYLYHLKTRALLGELPFPDGLVFVLRFSRDGQTLLAAGGHPVQAGHVILYDVRTGKQKAVIGQENDVVLAADLSPDGTKVALGGPAKLVKVFSVADGKLLYQATRHTDWITALSFSPDGATLATGDRAGGIFLWDAQSGSIIVSLAEHKDSVTALAWRRDGKVLASTGEDGEMVLWDPQDGFPIATDTKTHIPKVNGTVYGKPVSGILSADFMPDGRLVTLGRDRLIHVFTADGKPQSATPPFDRFLTKIATANDTSTIVAGDYNGGVVTWDGKKADPLPPIRTGQ